MPCGKKKKKHKKKTHTNKIQIIKEGTVRPKKPHKTHTKKKAVYFFFFFNSDNCNDD